MGSKDMPPLATSFWRIFLKSQLHYKAQVVIITGGNQGLGFESARQFLSLHLSHLIITVRSEEKGKAAALKLQAEYPNATISVWLLDMCSYDSIQTFVKRVESELPHLDIAILNAGRSKADFELVPSTGHEETLQLSYLSTILLATLLLPILKSKSPQGTPGRLSIVSSGTALATKFSNSQQSPLLKSFDDIKASPTPGLQTYGATKLLCHMFIYKLVDYVSADDVVVSLVDPGMTRGTGLNRDMPKVIRTLVVPMLFAISRSCNKRKESHGCFIMDWEIRPFPPLLYTPKGKTTIERLWQETLDEFDFAGVQSVLESMKKN
ncbi:hypothetical protein POJ06DRAFT_293350 [Lipomyces tetrasporus]|uniref:NAD(P)-binding protein n=1 Tax=Lipomyces tetrasporus TaxID=54092 RepID=A0AAD7VWF2_9ASCO|nr:uncharacterized protein POJ06DRAFT_293350 [Lipomyces tetrasporus]KAJ8103420.1 hypothetical protein POJ06DRAFT_293350 [Lipomyces tetrasporus]